MRNRKYDEGKLKMKRLGKEKRVPVCGQFELTARCNFDCKMCYIHNQESNSYRCRELTTEQWKRIFDEAYDAGMMFATLTGGECLLREDFKELYLHLWQKRVLITILTNGALINDDLLKFFKEYPPDSFQISLYGNSEDCYRRVTGHSGFARVLDNVQKLKDAGHDVCIVVTPSKYIANDYIDTLKLIQENGFENNMGEMILAAKQYDADATDHYLTEDEIIRLSVERTKLYRQLYENPDIPQPCGSCTEAPLGLGCNAGRGLAVITWEGWMYPCCSAMLGGASLLEMSYAEAWEKTKQAADEAVRCMECVDCPYDNVCFKCPAIRALDLKSGHCNPKICELTRKLVEAGVYKLDQPTESCD